jgi:hypothetical protein
MKELRGEIDFSSDGLTDSLTDALAPARFHELLIGELTMANREQRKITLISLRLLRGSIESEGLDSAKEVERIHLELQSLSLQVRRLLRGGDQIGRLSEDGFWILIRGDIRSAEIACDRFMLEMGESMLRDLWQVRYCESEVGEELRNLLRRMDQIHFTK